MVDGEVAKPRPRLGVEVEELAGGEDRPHRRPPEPVFVDVTAVAGLQVGVGDIKPVERDAGVDVVGGMDQDVVREQLGERPAAHDRAAIELAHRGVPLLAVVEEGDVGMGVVQVDERGR